jgi:hypothetical protein
MLIGASSMSTPAKEIALPFSPFNAILHNGIDRLMDLVNHDSFTFVVNGENCESTVPKAILLSPTIHTSLQSNPLNGVFEFSRDSVNSSDFGDFLKFVRSRDCASIPPFGIDFSHLSRSAVSWRLRAKILCCGCWLIWI